MASSAAATAWSSCADAGGSEQDCETEALNEYTKNRGNPKRWAKQKEAKEGEEAKEAEEAKEDEEADEAEEAKEDEEAKEAEEAKGSGKEGKDAA